MAKKKNKTVKVDTVSGSRSYNRLDMQVSQTMHMAIELYDSINYLLILDHYDDITLFDLDANPLAVSYYQMKTSEDKITIDSAISEGWISKLYSHLQTSGEWLVNELGLITNIPLEVRCTVNVENKQNSQKLKNDRTPFDKLCQSVQDKIKTDIASKNGVPIDKVDLSKFAHLHTTLSIERHKDIVEKEIQDFLYDKYPRITVDTVKCIYGSLIDILTKRQECENVSDDAELEEVKRHKGFSKTELDRVIDKAIMLSLPEFDKILRFANIEERLKTKFSLPYVQILSDSNNPKDETFNRVFCEIQNEICDFPYNGDVTLLEYAYEIGQRIHKKDPSLKSIYYEDYIAVLTLCILINKTRKKR